VARAPVGFGQVVDTRSRHHGHHLPERRTSHHRLQSIRC